MDGAKQLQAGQPLEHEDPLPLIEDKIQLPPNPVRGEASSFRPRLSHQGQGCWFYPEAIALFVSHCTIEPGWIVAK